VSRSATVMPTWSKRRICDMRYILRISWCRGPRRSRPSPGERSQPAVLDTESRIQLLNRRVGKPFPESGPNGPSRCVAAARRAPLATPRRIREPMARRDQSRSRLTADLVPGSSPISSRDPQPSSLAYSTQMPHSAHVRSGLSAALGRQVASVGWLLVGGGQLRVRQGVDQRSAA
jgi:hypothetical protein